MNDYQFQASMAHQSKIKQQALKVTPYFQVHSLDDKGVRFPGLHQRKVSLKAGHSVESGALPLPSDIVLHESVSMQLRDGTELFTDIFLPPRFQDLGAKAADPVPAVVAWSPYGKQKGTHLLDDYPLRGGVPKHHVSRLEKFEGPDPAFWCTRDYAVVNVDVRGAFTSEGDLMMWNHQEAEDGADFVTWLSRQPWCNGKVALAGNSWLAVSQWKIASLRPEGLAAIAPWEGFCDIYRNYLYTGGILHPGFHKSLTDTFVSQARCEDVIGYARNHDTFDPYWEDKCAIPERINVPVYAVASWTSPIHTAGTFEAWERLPDESTKWLRVHNEMEWPDFYKDHNQKDLQRFFDYYLKGRTNNGWFNTPKVRLSVLHFGLTHLEDTVARPESTFPLERTKYTKLFLHGNNSLSLDANSDESLLSHDSASAKQEFLYEIPETCETTGWWMAHLAMSSLEHTDMDVFVQVEKLTPNKNRTATMMIKPTNAAIRRLLKFMHDWDIVPASAGICFHRGPDGCLRASHALDKDETLSRPEHPVYLHQKKVPLRAGEVRTLDIPMRPYGMFWEKGDILRFTVQGSSVIPFPFPGLEMHNTDNKGLHVIHCGGRGQDSSYLLVPLV